MPNVLYLTKGVWNNEYVDCALDTIYQDFYDKIVKLKNPTGKQIYKIKTDIFKSDMNLWHKIWKIVEKYCTFFEKIVYIVIVNFNKGMTI